MIVNTLTTSARIKTRMLIIFIALCLTACQAGDRDGIQIALSDPDQTVYQLATTVYTAKRLRQIEQSGYNYHDLSANYPVQCVRQAGKLYRVAYRATDRLLLLYYNQQGKLLFHKRQTPTVAKQALDMVNVQDNVYAVKAIDPTGTYDFLYTGDTEIPRVSAHYTTDGYLLHIEYDERWRVAKMSWELI